jgi:hypothetical protein
MPVGIRSTASQHIASEEVNHRLSLYCLAAAASGVSLLALIQPAHASIVVTSTSVTVGPGSAGFIDMNGDGKNDFEFFLQNGGYDHSFYRTLVVMPLTGGRAVGGARAPLGPYGSALASGGKIGPSAHFSSSIGRGQVTLERTQGAFSGSTLSDKAYGPWGVNSATHYLGVRFLISGKIHYGWIKLSVTKEAGSPSQIQATITEFAYNTVANQKMTAGQTAVVSAGATQRPSLPGKPSTSAGPSLGMLAAGADALPLWRREELEGNSLLLLAPAART